MSMMVDISYLLSELGAHAAAEIRTANRDFFNHLQSAMKSGRQSRASQNQIPPSSTRFVLETAASKFAHHGQWPPVTCLRIALCIIRGFLLGHGTTPGQWPSAFQKMFSIAQTLVFRAGTFRFVRTPLFVIDDVLDCCQSCRDLLSQKLPPATINHIKPAMSKAKNHLATNKFIEPKSKHNPCE